MRGVWCWRPEMVGESWAPKTMRPRRATRWERSQRLAPVPMPARSNGHCNAVRPVAKLEDISGE